MQNVKKYFTEGLIQFTILLSLIGVRVDVDSYLNGYYSPLEINNGPSSAYIQTPFHSLRDNWDGYSVHPKCPELDYFFACRRLLDEVRALGSPIRFPTQLSAWLVHQVPDSSEFREPPNSTSNINVSVGLLSESTGEEANDTELLAVDESHTAAQLSEPGPYPSTGACEIPNEEVEALKGRMEEDEDEGRAEPVSLTQLTLSSTLEHEGLLSSGAPLSSPEDPPPPDIDQHWSQFLSLPIYEFDDLHPLVPQQLSDLDANISSAISQDVSLRDAIVTGSVYDMIPPRGGVRTLVARQPRGPLFRLESTNSSHSDSSPGTTTGLAILPYAAVVNGTRNGSSSHGALEGCLDEAVFDQINLLGLEGCLDTMDAQLLGILQGIYPRVLEDLDSDSGLSLESSSQGPDSPGASEVSSSSSSSFFEDEGGATGYSSEVDSLPSKCIDDYDTWSPVDLSESVWHDHSYSSPAFSQPSPTTFPHKAIKEEPFSDEDDGEDNEDRELSRDQLRTRALHVPFSVTEIVSMPVEELLEGRGLSPAQVALLRDIRRRGKNKLAAQNCRKRKLDAITGLQEEVERLQAQRNRLLRERQHTAKALGAAGQRMEDLSRDIFSRLRDSSGRPLTPERYTLQCEANGRFVVQQVRRPSVAATTAGGKTDKRKKKKP